MKKTLSIAAVLLLGVTYASAELVTNGGFEDPYHTLNNGTNPNDWTVFETALGSNADRQVRTKTTLPHTGSMCLELGAGGSDDTGYLYQTIATVIGQEYTFSVWGVRANNNVLDSHVLSFSAEVLAGTGIGGARLNFLDTGDLGDPVDIAYAEFTFNFTATSIDTTVLIANTSSGVTTANDAIVDDVSITAIPPEPDVAWDAGGNGVNWGDAANWDTDEVPGTYADGSALIGNGGSATVAANFTGTYAYDVIVSNSSSLNIAADLQNVGAMDVGTDVGSAATVNQTTGAVASTALNISVAGNTADVVYTLTDGSHAVSGNVTVQSNGVLNVDGGAFTPAGQTIVENGGVLRVTGGTTTMATGYAQNGDGTLVKAGGLIEVSGGTYVDTSRLDVSAGGAFRVVGDDVTSITLHQVNGSSTFEFVLDETGVSDIVNDSYGSLATIQFVIDGSNYVGGVNSILLYTDTSSNADQPNYTVTDLGTEGVDWEIVQDSSVGRTITLNILKARPTSSGVDVRAFQTADGVVVEFVAYDVEADGSIQLALMGADGNPLWTGSVEVTAGPRFFARFLVPGLELGGTYDFQIRDEVGKWWDVPGVTVQPFAAEMTSASLAGLTIAFDSLADHEYEIQWAAELGDAWETVETVTAEAGRTSVVVAHPDPEGASGFFRVRIK